MACWLVWCPKAKLSWSPATCELFELELVQVKLLHEIMMGPKSRDQCPHNEQMN